VRWLPFAACVCVTLIIQTALGDRLTFAGARPDLPLVLVVFVGLYAPRSDACLAGWIIGLGADLLSIERLGVFSATFCLLALAVVSFRDLLFLKSPGTHFFVTFGSGVAVQLTLSAYTFLAYPDATGFDSSYLAAVVGTAGFTACLAVPVDWLLLNISSSLGLHTSRYSHRPRSRTRKQRV
jgi:rod shape-determining protein MreD